MKVQISPLLGFERNFWPSPELMQGILAWSMDPRITGTDSKYEYIPAIGYTTSQAARNYICDRFLDQGDCDYLIMIDNDMKPIHPVTHELANVMHLPAMGLPIVAAPTAVMKGLDWFMNGYYKDYEGGWRAMSLEELQHPKPDMVFNTQWGPAVKVDSVGFGCVCLRRDVVEKVRASGIDYLDSATRRPHTIFIDSEKVTIDCRGVTVTRNRTPRGETHAGEDMIFGPRTKALGYDTYMAPACIMGHYHTVDLAQMTSIRPSLKFPDYGLTHPHPMPDEWSISVELSDYLRKLAYETKPSQVLELGAGISTFVLAESMRYIGAVCSLEEDEKQANRIRQLLRNGDLDATVSVHYVPLDDTGFYQGVPASRPIDLMLVDGPSGKHESRGQASRFFNMLSEDSYVILDDTHRPYEQSVVKDWCENYPLRVVEFIDSTDDRVSTILKWFGGK